MNTTGASRARRAGLLAVLLSAVLAAHAEGDACIDSDDTACHGVGAEPSGWRQSIDTTRDRLAEKLYGLQLSAFADAASSYNDAGAQSLDFGTFELDASMEFGHDLQAATAFVTDRNGTVMTVGFLDFYTSGGRAAPHGRLWAEKGYRVQAGRFDVPFGNDWQFFASKDSVSISRPLTTERLMDGGYNDDGLRVLGNNGSVNFTSYALRGFNQGRLVGGRIGVTPFSDPFSLAQVEDAPFFELGLSYLYDSDAHWNRNESAKAFDMELHRGDWAGRIEFMQRDQQPLGGDRLRGWHVTQEFVLDDWDMWKTALFARVEQAWTQAADSRDARFAYGAKINVGNSDVLQWKIEAQHYRTATPDTQAQPGYGKWLWFTQLVLVL
jgi:hypothetical protein